MMTVNCSLSGSVVVRGGGGTVSGALARYGAILLANDSTSMALV